ncbi:MAG: hypothetical protein KAS23_05855, partial [Anaerohalosphaera sp.]|nr:hypothetical protein [Anaerohalosphaera sp.]
MSADSDKLAELLELAGALRQESINEQQLRRLEELIGEDAEMRGHYIIYVRMCAELRSRRRDAAISELLARQTADRHDEITEAVLDEKLWQELAESEINAPEVYVERPRSKKELPPIEPYVIQRGQKRVISRSLMY